VHDLAFFRLSTSESSKLGCYCRALTGVLKITFIPTRISTRTCFYALSHVSYMPCRYALYLAGEKAKEQAGLEQGDALERNVVRPVCIACQWKKMPLPPLLPKYCQSVLRTPTSLAFANIIRSPANFLYFRVSGPKPQPRHALRRPHCAAQRQEARRVWPVLVWGGAQRERLARAQRRLQAQSGHERSNRISLVSMLRAWSSLICPFLSCVSTIYWV